MNSDVALQQQDPASLSTVKDVDCSFVADGRGRNFFFVSTPAAGAWSDGKVERATKKSSCIPDEADPEVQQLASFSVRVDGLGLRSGGQSAMPTIRDRTHQIAS